MIVKIKINNLIYDLNLELISLNTIVALQQIYKFEIIEYIKIN